VIDPEMHSLDEDFVFKGKRINSFTFLGTQYKVFSWAEMIADVTKLIYEIDPAPLYQLIMEGSSDLLSKKENWNTKIGEGLYLYTGNDTNTKIRILKKIFTKYELDESELEFGIPIQPETVETEEN